MSAQPQSITASAPLARQWQFPLLFASMALFAAGLINVIPATPPRAFDEEMADFRRRIASGESIAVYKDLSPLLADKTLDDRRRGVVNQILGTAVHAAERGVAEHSVENCRRVIGHIKTARDLGYPVVAMDDVRIGDAWDWQNDPTQAIASYREALAAGADNASMLRRRVVNRVRDLEIPDLDLIHEQLGLIIDDPRATPSDLIWAVELTVQDLLDQDKPDEALALVDEIDPRLEGTTLRAELVITRARCLVSEERIAEADRLLRDFRNKPGPRDELWARAGTMLARVVSVDGRPEVGLSMLEEIALSFPDGPRFLEVLDARADVLVQLERYEEAAEAYERIVDISRKPSFAGVIDPVLTRARMLALAELLSSRDRPDDGLRFLTLAQDLATGNDTAQSAMYETLLANLNWTLGERAEAEADSTVARDERDALLVKARGHFSDAGRALTRAAALRVDDDDAVGDLIWRAVESLERARDVPGAMALMERFIDNRPSDLRRPDAIYRLAATQQAHFDFAGAATTYEQLLREYPQVTRTLQAYVPWAQCRINMADEDSIRRAEALLLRIVDQPPDERPLFEPQAPEFADALFLMAELYYQQKRYEELIFRVESMLIPLHPADPRISTARFMLADSYRRSGLALFKERDGVSDNDRRQRLTAEATDRIERAAGLFQRVADDDLSNESRLTSLEQTRLRASWMYRGDCMFDLGDFEAARRIYAEASWRFDNELTAVTAAMQTVHCYNRLGMADEARAALARLRILVQKMPEVAFADHAGAPDRQYWLETVDRMLKTSM